MRSKSNISLQALHGRAATIARLLAMLFLFSQSWMSYAAVGSGSHEAPHRAGHDDGVHAPQSGDHGHAHDDAADDRSSEQQNGHNPADHTHDKPNVERHAAFPFSPAVNEWEHAPPSQGHPAPYLPFERPPRSYQAA